MPKYQPGDKIVVELTVCYERPAVYAPQRMDEKSKCYKLLAPGNSIIFWAQQARVDECPVLKHIPAPRKWEVGDVYVMSMDASKMSIIDINQKWVTVRESESPDARPAVVYRLDWENWHKVKVK